MAAPADAAPGPGPRADDPNERRLGWFGLGVAAGSFLCGLFAATLIGVSYAVARGFDEAEADRDLGFALATSFGLWVGFLALPIAWSAFHGGPRRYLGLAARWVDLPLGLVVGLGAVIATALVSSAVLSTGDQEALESKAKEVIDRAHGPLATTLLVLALCVVTPVAEEVFFRGLLFRSLDRVASTVVALLLGGLVFGVVHYDGASAAGDVVAVQLGMLALFGLALCAVLHHTGRLGAAIVAHAVFNSVTVISLLASR